MENPPPPSIICFTIAAEILVRSLDNFYCQICRQTHEFIIYAMRQRARANSLTICCRKKQIDHLTNWRQFSMRLFVLLLTMNFVITLSQKHPGSTLHLVARFISAKYSTSKVSTRMALKSSINGFWLWYAGWKGDIKVLCSALLVPIFGTRNLEKET